MELDSPTIIKIQFQPTLLFTAFCVHVEPPFFLVGYKASEVIGYQYRKTLQLSACFRINGAE
jgi:hypothetical protein